MIMHTACTKYCRPKFWRAVSDFLPKWGHSCGASCGFVITFFFIEPLHCIWNVFHKSEIIKKKTLIFWKLQICLGNVFRIWTNFKFGVISCFGGTVLKPHNNLLLSSLFILSLVGPENVVDSRQPDKQDRKEGQRWITGKVRSSA